MINLNIFDTIGEDIVKVNSHFIKDVNTVRKIAKHSLATALKIAGSSDTDSIKKAFIEDLVMATAANYGQSITPEQAALIADALVKGLDEIATGAGMAIEK